MRGLTSRMKWGLAGGVACAVGAVLAGQPATAFAQMSGINPNKDCQTITTCNFKRGGVYRGCVSSYSCRQCRFVPARCSIATARGKCHEVRCTWGG